MALKERLIDGHVLDPDRPFLRLQLEAEVTGTFKLRKVELQREGWDPAKLEDPLFVRDDAARAYVPLDARLHSAVAAGEVRL